MISATRLAELRALIQVGHESAFYAWPEWRALRPEVLRIIGECSAVIHAGDINSQKIIDEMRAAAKPDVPFYIVRGNNDKEWAEELPLYLEFQLEECRIFLVHNRKDVPRELGDVDMVIFGHSHKYFEQCIDGRLWLNPGSCGRRRFNQDITLAVLNIEDGKWSVNRIDIAHESGTSRGKGGVKNAGSGSGRHMERIPMPDEKDLLKVITQIMKRMDKGQDVTKIAGDMKIDPGFAEQICRIRVTHPGVTAHGILDKVEVNRTGR